MLISCLDIYGSKTSSVRLLYEHNFFISLYSLNLQPFSPFNSEGEVLALLPEGKNLCKICKPKVNFKHMFSELITLFSGNQALSIIFFSNQTSGTPFINILFESVNLEDKKTQQFTKHQRKCTDQYCPRWTIKNTPSNVWLWKYSCFCQSPFPSPLFFPCPLLSASLFKIDKPETQFM